MGLLDAAGGIRRGVVDLHDLPARGRAGVLDRDGNVVIDISVLADPLFHAVQSLRKARVAQAEAEGIHDRAVVVDEALLRGGLIVPIAVVDALRVFDGADRMADAVRVGIDIAARSVLRLKIGMDVGIGRVLRHVGLPDIHQAAGGVHAAVQDLADGDEAVQAGMADPQAGVDVAQGAVLDPAELDLLGGVQDHDDLIEVRRDVLDELLLLPGELQAVPQSGGGEGLVRLELAAQELLAVSGAAGPAGLLFQECLRGAAGVRGAAGAAENDDRRVVVALVGIEHRAGEGRRVHLGDPGAVAAEGDRAVRHREAEAVADEALLRGRGVIKRPQRGVDAEAGALQGIVNRSVHIRRVTALRRAGAAARVERVRRRLAEHADRGHLLEGQDAVLVFHEDDALFRDPPVDLQRRRPDLIQRRIAGIVFAVIHRQRADSRRGKLQDQDHAQDECRLE